MLRTEELVVKVDDEGGKKCLLDHISFEVKDGEILVKQGKYDDAVNAYTKIKDKYFQSYQAMDIDKYIEQAKLMKK